MYVKTPLRRSGPPLTEAQIKRFEAQLGKPLPAEYRAFLLESNGGCPANQRVPIATPDYPAKDISLDVLLHIDAFLFTPSRDAHADSVSLAHAQLNPVLPKDLLIIGEAAIASRFVIYTDGPKRGQVHVILWDIVDLFPEAPSRRTVTNATRFVASDFHEFFLSLN